MRTEIWETLPSLAILCRLFNALYDKDSRRAIRPPEANSISTHDRSNNEYHLQLPETFRKQILSNIQVNLSIDFALGCPEPALASGVKCFNLFGNLN